MIERDWLALLRQPAFVRMVLAAALVLGSHAMHDAFAIIRWRDAGISPAVSSMLWSESVGAEVLVFVLLGPWLLAYWAGAVHWPWPPAQRRCAGELWLKLLTLPPLR